MAAKGYDYERQKLIDTQAGRIAEMIGVAPEEIAVDGNRGVSLTVEQMEKFIGCLLNLGYFKAIQTLREAGEKANIEGPERNFTQWAVFVSAASFLEGTMGQ